jgi:hypothetical protein
MQLLQLKLAYPDCLDVAILLQVSFQIASMKLPQQSVMRRNPSELLSCRAVSVARAALTVGRSVDANRGCGALAEVAGGEGSAVERWRLGRDLQRLTEWWRIAKMNGAHYSNYNNCYRR